MEKEGKGQGKLPPYFLRLTPKGHRTCNTRTEGLSDFSFSQRTFTTSYDPYQRADSINFMS